MVKSYDGIAALKRMLQECKIPSRSSVNIAKVLYDISNKKEYLDILFLNYKEEESNLETVQGKFISTPIFEYIGVMGKATRYQKSKLFIKS